jgi:hypothetical protein
LMYREYAKLPRDGQLEFMERERRIVLIFQAIVEDGNAAGVFACPHPDLAAVNILTAAHSWSLKLWLLPRGIDAETYVEQQLALIRLSVGAR